MGKDYNKTINLPQTDFPMRASLAQREPNFLKIWQEHKTYEKLQKLTEGRPLKVLHDGPPFSNGNIHMGTAMNKILKDFINRYNSMAGFHSPYIPGWDNHGMPIESAIIKMNKLDRKKMTIPEFRNACKEFAQKYVNIQMDQFVRLGVLGDWEHPYLTMDPSFEAREVKVFGEMYKKGYIYKGLKPVYWCPHDETALAEAEIEYQDDPVTTVFVKFQMNDDLGKLGHLDHSKLYFLIWTTTIWTLPGNLAIVLHPSESYAIVKTGSGEMYILAEVLVDTVMAKGGVTDYEIVERHPGNFFENMLATHPFLPKTSRLLLADYVTMDSGTGCVHTAPGFGADDYQTCRRYGMEMVVPVDDRGRHTDYAGKYAGMTTDESNPVILEDMRQSGALFAAEDIVHSYPHCWRCKNPIIFRATPQWFCSVDAFKEEAVAACRDVTWLPAWGGERIAGMIRERADWCISRQRHWGLPIPVFYCKDCGKPVCTDETIEKVSEVFGAEGSNAWYEKDVVDLLPKGFKCPHCGGVHFTRETDTLDGWFDSGSSHFAVMEDKIEWPADIYLEGADQYRGWFQSSLLTAVGAKGQGAPYKTVLTHGWVVDGEGKAMHKSLGNSVDPNDMVKEYGADIVRLWVASSDYHADVRASKEIFKQLSEAYRKIRNTARYILGNLDGFDPKDMVSPEEMTELDRWAVTRLNALIEKSIKGYEDFEFHIVYQAIRNFCVVDMSNFYLDVIKDRLYCEDRTGVLRRSAQSAMYMILDAMVRLLAPILSFTADEIWHAMAHKDTDEEENVAFNAMAKPFTAYALDDAAMARWDELVALRDQVNLALEEARGAKLIGKPLEACVQLTLPAEQKAVYEPQKELLKTLFIVSDVTFAEGEFGVKVVKAEGEKCERCWAYTGDVGSDPELPGLCARCAAVVRRGFDISAL